MDNMHGVFDIRLKENFKLFVTGPSRCGKTVFVSKLLENIHAFSKLPPMSVLYIYKVWQPKYDEIKSLGVNFIEDNDNVVNSIKSGVSGQPMPVIFDDLIVATKFFLFISQSFNLNHSNIITQGFDKLL